MINRERLVEQHALEYVARSRHQQELAITPSPPVVATSLLDRQLMRLRYERQQYLDHMEQVRQEVRQHWQENGFEEVGPMVIWEAVAERLGRWFVH